MEYGDNTVSRGQDDLPVLWLRIREHNSWEGETWYSYFLAESGVEEALQAAVRSQSDLKGPDRVLLTESAAEALANEDNGDYMQAHWFGKLTNFKAAQASTDDLYKGGIRSFGEELMGYVEEDLERGE